ncbi:hypothetical protein [Actinoplanes utahensis]|uniref:Peptidase inhibitor family I36 n=1 Tax=Actinoplanes utahensis TaxID=1869 RepID=A0A0A6UN17_ACTUT|nr:hypothetical protein [Actinoplanes utahensis]KHD75714.1 hypothetical protein MB27_21065 [Actinoplanes utahensis]GIF34541.1 hypothetical protein Aut01nite_75270 [Actinoplanes utahensis]
MRNLKRAVVTVLTVVSLTTSGTPAYAADTTTTRTCGGWTCSVYYSRAATADIDNYLQGHDVQQVEVMKKTFCKRFGRVGSMSCKALKFGDWNVRRIIHHAATTNGCVRFRTPRGAAYLPGPVYSDHSRICRSMG